MRITVLGGAGFIGAHLVESLLMDDHEITIFDCLNIKIPVKSDFLKKLTFVEGDFNNCTEVMSAIYNAEVVIHAISATLPESSLANPIYDIESNLICSINLLKICVDNHVRKVIFLSSGGTVYGVPKELPILESHPCNPINPYGISKLAIEKYLELFSYQYGLEYVVLRLSNPYGSNQRLNKRQGVISAWLANIAQNKTIEIWGDGEVVRDYIYIDDAIEAIKLAISSNITSKVMNVGAGIGYSLNVLHSLIENILNKKVFVTYKHSRPADVQTNILDINLIKKELNWQPATSISLGIEKTWISIKNAHEFS